MMGVISLIICLWLCSFHYKVRSETIIQILAKQVDFKRPRWDKADLSGYYKCSYEQLSHISVLTLPPTCDHIHEHLARQQNVSFYSDIIYALHCAAASTVPIGKADFFKFWWDQECQAMKDESISKHCTWKAEGRPRDGPIAAAMRKPKYEYKLLLRQKSFQSQLCFNNELHDAFSDKDPTRFWRSWNEKFGHKSNSEVISGHSDHQSIADTFSDLYAKQSLPNNSNTHNKLIQEFLSMYSTYSLLALPLMLNLLFM